MPTTPRLCCHWLCDQGPSFCWRGLRQPWLCWYLYYDLTSQWFWWWTGSFNVKTRLLLDVTFMWTLEVMSINSRTTIFETSQIGYLRTGTKDATISALWSKCWIKWQWPWYEAMVMMLPLICEMTTTIDGGITPSYWMQYWRTSEWSGGKGDTSLEMYGTMKCAKKQRMKRKPAVGKAVNDFQEEDHSSY